MNLLIRKIINKFYTEKFYYDSRVDGATHAVKLLNVQLRQRVVLDSALLLEIARGRHVHNVADHELAHSLICGSSGVETFFFRLKFRLKLILLEREYNFYSSSILEKRYFQIAPVPFGTQREQFEQRTMAVWPRPCLLRPLFLRFDGIFCAQVPDDLALLDEERD